MAMELFSDYPGAALRQPTPVYEPPPNVTPGILAPQPQQQSAFQMLAPAAIGLLGSALGGGSTFAGGYSQGMQQATRNRFAQYQQQLAAWRAEQQARAREAAQQVDQERLDLQREQFDYQRNAPPEAMQPTSMMREYEMARTQGYDGSLLDFIQARRPTGTTVNVNPPPSGYIQVPTEDGSVEYQPVPGGPADPATAAEKAAQTASATQQAKKADFVVEASTKVANLASLWQEAIKAADNNDLAALRDIRARWHSAVKASGESVYRARAAGNDPGDKAQDKFIAELPSLEAQLASYRAGMGETMTSVLGGLAEEMGGMPAQGGQGGGASQPTPVVAPVSGGEVESLMRELGL